MSLLEVNKITPQSGTTLVLGDSGDTINFGSGVLPNFENLTVTGDLTVDTNSLKVDSTNNYVGIGTASPSVALDVVGAITATGNITGTLATAAQPNITSVGTLTSATVSGDLTVDTNTLYVDSTNNRVGIGTTSPSRNLHLVSGASTALELERTAVGSESKLVLSSATSFNAIYSRDGADSDKDLLILTGSTERMSIKGTTVVVNGSSNDIDFRVESNNNTHALFVDGGSDITLFGKSSANSTTTGTELYSSGIAIHTVNGNRPLLLNRLTSDGDIIELRKDSSTVGSIGTVSSGNLVIEGDTSLRLHTDGQERLILDSTECIFNNASYDQDFRIESNNNANMLFVNGGTDRIGVGTNAPASHLDIRTASGTISDLNQTLTIEERSTWTQGLAIGLYNTDLYASDRPSTFLGSANSTSAFYLSGGARVTNNPGGASWATATSSASTFIVGNGGELKVYADTGLTATTAFTPTERLRLNSAGRFFVNTTGDINSERVGITAGTNEQALGLKVTTNNYSLIQGWDSSNNIRFTLTGTGALTNYQGGAIFNENGANSDFRVESDNNTHALFVDGGNDAVLFGSTTVDPVSGNVAGSSIKAQGIIQASRDGGIAIYANRKGTDGDIFEVRKDGTAVGSIGTGTTDADFIIGRNDTYLGFRDGVDDIIPHGGATRRDNAIDLGDASYRFKDAYFGGTVNAGAISVNAGGEPITITSPALNVRYAISDGTINADFGIDAGLYGFVRTATAHDFMIMTQNLERMVFKSGGDVIINEDSYDSDFRVESNNNTHALFVDGGNDKVLIGTGSSAISSRFTSRGAGLGSGTWTIIAENSNGNQTFGIRDDGYMLNPQTYNATTASAENVHVTSAGYFFRSTSSRRYKNTINDATKGLDYLCNLRPVTFKGNDTGDKLFYGLIAEEVDEAGLSEFVDYNDNNEADSVQYSRMVSLCVKAIQELKADNDALRTRIETLENT